MRLVWIVGCVCALVLAAMLPASADVMPDGYRMEPFARGLADPEAVALAPDGRIFYLERLTGNVRIIENGTLLPNPFVTVSVPQAPEVIGEQGLLGIALHPDFGKNGWVYLYYTQASPRTNRIVRYTASGNTGATPTVILDNIGAAPNGEDNGGALVFGTDGKLYAAVGTLEADASAQVLTSLAGKLLRMNDDGTVPGDNPFVVSEPYPYSLIYGLGLRNTAGVAADPDVGTVYATDNYDDETGVSCDEVDAVASGQNYGWDIDACTGGSHQPPLDAVSPKITTWGLSTYAGDGFPATASVCSNDFARTCTGTPDCVSPGICQPTRPLFVAGAGTGEIRRDILTDPSYDKLVSSSRLYAPTGANCPVTLCDVEAGKDGWLYTVSDDPTTGKAGIYRVIYDGWGGAAAEPREVSGSPHVEMTIAKSGGGLEFRWEDLKREAWACSTGHCPAGGETTKYTIWSGDLQSPFTYTHTSYVETNGTDLNDALLSYTEASMPSASKYYLVSARSSNLEGTLGTQSDDVTPRPGYATTDICDSIGYGVRYDDLDKCSQDWANAYPDQDNRPWKLSDLRGKAVYMCFVQFG